LLPQTLSVQWSDCQTSLVAGGEPAIHLRRNVRPLQFRNHAGNALAAAIANMKSLSDREDQGLGRGEQLPFLTRKL